MPEIRIDPLSGHKTIIAGERSRRPGGEPSCAPAEPIDPERDPFAEGHEDRTPPELYALRPVGHGGPGGVAAGGARSDEAGAGGAAASGAANSPGWTVRVVPNLYPALTAADPEQEDGGEGSALGGEGSALGGEGSALGGERSEVVESARGRPELFVARPATGAHEVIINGPQSVLSLADLPVEQVLAAVEVWRERMRAHAQSAYLQLIVNERREAGASLPHTHAQLYALDFVPAIVARERERANAYTTRTMGQSLLGDVIAEEVRLRERIVAVDEEAVLIAPYASQLPFQLMLAPRRPRARFEDDGPSGAALLHDGLCRLARHLGSSPPLNLFVRTAPLGAEHFCWRIDILPRLTHLAGLELSTGVNLNIVAPEHAAAALRDA
jgi:UDPglucose--hexose-1-phosphate uridylyltransferase